MKTDDLISLLSTNVEPVEHRQTTWIIGIALLASVAVDLIAVILVLGVRVGLTEIGVLTWLFVKAAFTFGILIPASFYLFGLARPGGERRISFILVALPFVVVILLAAVSLGLAPISHWKGMVVGNGWLECLISIPLIAVVPFALIVWAVRQAAPTDLARAGAFVGLVAGCLSATGYALHCADDSMPFITLWYGGTIALCTFAGWKLGPVLLRW